MDNVEIQFDFDATSDSNIFRYGVTGKQKDQRYWIFSNYLLFTGYYLYNCSVYNVEHDA